MNGDLAAYKYMAKTCVLFDFAGTIADLTPSRESILRNYIYDQTSYDINESLLSQCYGFADLTFHYSSVRHNTKQLREEFYIEYNRILLSYLGILHLTTPNQLYEYFTAQKAHWSLKLGTRRVFDFLSNQGYQIGIISNFDSCLSDLLYGALGLGDVIDFIHVSESEGDEKPSKAFYLHFFEKYSVSISESLLIGDNYLLDYLPASSISLDALLLDEAGRYPNLPYVIRRIEDLLTILPIL